MSEAAHPPTIELPECRRIGVLSDTHIPHRLHEMPARVYETLAGCDAILHAGDLETPDVLAPLQQIAPTYAVRGNLHWQFSTGAHDQDLPLSLLLRAGARTIWMTHGHISFAHSVFDKVLGFGERRTPNLVNTHLIARLARMRPPEASIVVFGHSHLSCAEWRDGVLYFNPGAVSPSAERHSKEAPRVGVLTLEGDRVAYAWRDV